MLAQALTPRKARLFCAGLLAVTDAARPRKEVAVSNEGSKEEPGEWNEELVSNKFTSN